MNRNLLCCIIFFSAGIFFSIYFYSKPIHDYGNYYYGSRFVLEGKNINDIYEPYRFNLAVRELPEMRNEKFLLNYAVVPPATLFFYIPLTGVEVHLSKFLFNLVSVLVFCYFLFRLLTTLHITSRWIFLLPILIILPFRNNILFGQGYLLLTGLMMGGFISESKNKNLPAAIYYALAIVLKISPAILLIYLLVRKKFHLLLLTALISSALFFAAVAISGWQLMQDYLFSFLPRMMQNEINNPYATNYQSVTVLLRNLFVPDQLLNPDAFNAPIAFSIISGISTGILFFLLIRKLKSMETDFPAFAFILFGSLVLTAYTSSYGLVFMIPFCIHAIAHKTKHYPVILLLLFGIACIPVNMFQSLPLAFRFPRLYMQVILFLMLTADQKLISIQLKWLVASIVFFTSSSIVMLKKKTDDSEYFLSNEAGLLSYNFQISGNNLLLKSLYEDGSREKEYAMSETATSIIPLNVVDGQVYLNGPVTSGNDRKLNPVLINHNMIFYLSDKNRGIGFYTLRKLVVNEKSE